MVTFSQDEKNLVIPSSLGNGQRSGGSGSGITPQEVQEMIDESLNEYDVEVNEKISGATQPIEDQVTANTQDIETLSGATEALGQDVANLSAQTAQITAVTAQIEALSGQSEQNTQAIETLSGATSALSGDVAETKEGLGALSSATETLGSNLDAVSGATDQNAQDIANLSAFTEAIEGRFADYTTTAVTGELSAATSGIAVNVEELSAATSGIAVDIETLSAYTAGIQDNDVIYEYETLNSKTQEERKAIWLECESYIQNSRKVWIHYHTIADERWYLVYDYYINRIRFVAFGLDKKHYINFSKNNGSLSLESYDILPTASDSTLGGIKVGSGLAIDGNGVLSVSGGSAGEQDFIVVDALSAVTNPVSGMVVYLKAHSWVSETEAYKVQRTTEGEGEMSHIKTQYEEGLFRAYLDGGGNIQSYTGDYSWVNDGLWHISSYQAYDGQEWITAKVRYKIHNDYETINNTYILFDKSYLTAQNFTVSPEAGQATSTEITDETDRYDVGKFYQYNGGNWELVSMPKVYYISEMSTVDKVALYNEISSAAGSGETDFSGYKVYYTVTIDGKNVNVPLSYSTTRDIEGHLELLFSGTYAAFNNPDATYIVAIGLRYDGSVQVYSNNSINNHHQSKLSVLRDRNWLKYDNGTYSGYTFDLSNVDPDTWAINWQQEGWGWLLQILKTNGEGYRDGDWNTLPDDNEYHFVDRNGHYYYRRLTGDTLTVLFTLNGPSSIGDLNLDANVSYTAATETISLYLTPNNNEIVYTGNTCSGEWSFEIAGMRNYCNGEDGSQNSTPVCSFKCASGTTAERSFSNPVISYQRIDKITLYDSNNNPYDFEHKFYFDYGLYTVSLIANESEYRYAQLTVVHN